MKKLLAVILSALIICTVCVTAFAAPATDLTKEQALAIALADAGVTQSEVTVTKTELDFEDGRYEYEIDFILKSDKTEYEYTVDANTGAIYEADIDYPDFPGGNDFISFIKWLFQLLANLFNK